MLLNLCSRVVQFFIRQLGINCDSLHRFKFALQCSNLLFCTNRFRPGYYFYFFFLYFICCFVPTNLDRATIFLILKYHIRNCPFWAKQFVALNRVRTPTCVAFTNVHVHCQNKLKAKTTH